MKKPKKHSILRIRKKNLTERQRLGTMIIPNKKKEANKKRCRGNYDL
jgi:hypothetical protein